VILPTGLDPEYFSPREAAFLFKGELGDRGYRALADHLESISLNSREPIQPGATASGIVFANRVVPTISAAVDLIGENWSERINLLVPVPGTEPVQRRLEELESIGRNQATEAIVDEVALRRALEALPCCATAGDGAADGPPLNLVVIGDPGDVISSFVRSLYRYRPVSPMRAFGRVQDISAKKISRWVAPKPLVIHGWLAPLRFRGEPVLIVQVSAPRGGRFAPANASTETSTRMWMMPATLSSKSCSIRSPSPSSASSVARRAPAEVSRPMASARSSSSIRSRFRSPMSISSTGSVSATPKCFDPKAANKR
jgi:hypothetical protein